MTDKRGLSLLALRLRLWWYRRLGRAFAALVTTDPAARCGRWSGYHDDGVPMVCDLPEHVLPWHYDQTNGLIWRSGQEPSEHAHDAGVDVSRWDSDEIEEALARGDVLAADEFDR